jgi:predicted HicB family RNase H-like nuclease
MNNILEHKGFFGSVEFSSEDDCLFGKIIGINDLITFEGNSVIELKTAFFEAVDDYLQLCEKAGKSPERTYKGSFNVRIEPELHKKAAIYASAKNISLNKYIENALNEQILKEQNASYKIDKKQDD